MEFPLDTTSFSQLWNKLINFTVVVCVLMSFSQADGTGNGFKVETDPLVKLQYGTKGLISCRITGKPLAVQWWKSDEIAHRRTILVFIDFIQVTIGERGGPGYDEGIYNITDDFSLVVHEVSFQDEGQYFCEVADQTRKIYDAQTILKVFVLPSEPFPTIQNCHSNSSIQNKGQNCTLYDTIQSYNVTCFIDGYTPDVNISIFFRHKSEKVEIIDTSEWQTDERRIGSSVTISANVSFYSYECLISTVLKKDEIVERVAAVTVRQRPTLSSDENGERTSEMAMISVAFFVSFIFPLNVFITISTEKTFNACGFVILLLCYAVPYVMITIGGMLKNKCPVEDLIPIYMIVMGSASLLALILIPIYTWIDEMITDESTRKRKNEVIVSVLLFNVVFIVAFFFAGNVWIYRIVWPNMTDPTSREYCHPTLYLFSFWLTTSTYIFIFVILICVCIPLLQKSRMQNNETSAQPSPS